MNVLNFLSVQVSLLLYSVLANSRCFGLLRLSASLLIFRETQNSCGVMKSELVVSQEAWFLESAIPLPHCVTLIMYLPPL